MPRAAHPKRWNSSGQPDYHREAAIALCAFLNRKGGGVLFGATPDGTAAGQNVGKRAMEEFSSEFGRINPPAYPTFERVRGSDDREAILVTVAPGSAGPYRYAGVAYLRAGDANRAMSAEECNGLLFERTRLAAVEHPACRRMVDQ